MFNIGRLALPLFVFVFAYNMARPDIITNGGATRAVKRLFAFALLATPPYFILSGQSPELLPLNILFTLLALALMIILIERSSYALAFFLFLVGGVFVEYWWFALALGLFSWLYFKHGSFFWLAAVLSCASLYLVNSNFWALAAIPLFYFLTKIDVKLPRFRWFFYAFYPLHLIALALIRIPLEEAGYIFF